MLGNHTHTRMAVTAKILSIVVLGNVCVRAAKVLTDVRDGSIAGASYEF